MLAAKRAVIFATEIGIHQSLFEGDSETIMKALQQRTLFSFFIWSFSTKKLCSMLVPFGVSLSLTLFSMKMRLHMP